MGDEQRRGQTCELVGEMEEQRVCAHVTFSPGHASFIQTERQSKQETWETDE